jgi:hypothetical protein
MASELAAITKQPRPPLLIHQSMLVMADLEELPAEKSIGLWSRPHKEHSQTEEHELHLGFKCRRVV